MAAVKTEAAITFERPDITTRFQQLPHIFDQARLGYDTLGIARHFPTLADYTTQNEITVERNELATRFQRLPLHLRPFWTRPQHSRHCLT